MDLSKLIHNVKDHGRLISLEKDDLVRIRLIAVRQGVWFKVLSKLERGILDLSLKVTRKIRSKVLVRTVRSIMKKILVALENKLKLFKWQIGIPLAKKISQIAQKWGNKTAYKWANDIGFIQYLTVMKGNTHSRNA